MVIMQVRFYFRFVGYFVEIFNSILDAASRIQGLTHTLSNSDVEMIKFPSTYLSETKRLRHPTIYLFECLPVRLAVAIHFCDLSVVPGHDRTTLLHPRSPCSPCTSFQQEDAYMPTRSVSSDAVAYEQVMDMPGRYSTLDQRGP